MRHSSHVCAHVYLCVCLCVQVSASRLPASPGTALLERVILGLQQQLEAAHAQMARYEAERGTFTQEIQRLGELSIGATKVCLYTAI